MDIYSKNKRAGDIAELRFLVKATEIGAVVSKPYGDNAAYDFIVDFNKSIRRVQVKSTSHQEKEGVYKLTAAYGGLNTKTPYSKEDVDFVAAQITSLDIWYIIPLEALKSTTVRLSPGKEDSRYEKYREAWHLLEI